jgi:hypothetical protein
MLVGSSGARQWRLRVGDKGTLSRASRRKWLAAIASSVGPIVSAMTAGAAAADSTGAQNARLINADCGSGPVTMVATGGGNWHSLEVIGSPAVFVPLSVEDEGVFTDAAGGAHLFSHPLSYKGSASPGGHEVVTCRFSVDTTFSDGSRLQASGSLAGFFTS